MTTSPPARPIQLYGFGLSGHVHRVAVFLSMLGLPFETIEVDLLKGEHRKPEFLALNAFGQVPVIRDGEVTLADSNAILVYLALRYDASGRWLPRDPLGAAQVQRWLSQAAGALAEGPARARAGVLFDKPVDPRCEKVAAHLFERMDEQLARQPFLAGSEPTIADIALYTYTAHAPEGGISLAPYAHLRAWLARIEALPGFVGMARSPALA